MVIAGAALVTAATGLAAPADLPEPTFRWSFDGGMAPEVVAAGAQAQVQGEPQFVEGLEGQALFVPEGCSIAFPTAGHRWRHAHLEPRVRGD